MSYFPFEKKISGMGSPKKTTPHANTKSVKEDVSNILRPKTKEEINDGEKYRKQLGQLHSIVGTNSKLRALSNWALNFFDDEPDIKEIAKFVSKKVDMALVASNHPREQYKGLNFLDFTNRDIHPGINTKILFSKKFFSRNFYKAFMVKNRWSFRTSIDKKTNSFKNSSKDSIKYRIPMVLASSLGSTDRAGGKCEEHSFLSLYLLNVGQMIQNMPHGQLKNDIFYTGAATAGHAMSLLVKGKEFKKAILRAKRETKGKPLPEINRILNWLILNTDKWGNNSWIVDGWDTKNVKTLAKKSKKLVPHYGMTQAFRRDTSSGISSKWDLTIKQMIYRVAKVHGVSIK